MVKQPFESKFVKQAKTVGELKSSHYQSRSVKQEMRDNLIDRLRRKEPIFPGIIGFDDTVIPQIVNAILSKHDILFLGLRGQAKTRIIRLLPTLLDEWMPTLAGSDMPDCPINPQLSPNRRILQEHGDDAAIKWIHRSERFHEKLATPDVTIADLIGEIDLVKHAEGRHLADEGVIHFGLIPRTNRGIFAINELPDLAPRIQVGLFNALEERDVQIRGFPVRLPLDICMAFTANPEDYTNRGRIVTPLKDRIGSVIRTHYPRCRKDAIEITRENAWLDRPDSDMRIDIPRYMLEIVEEVARLARVSPHVNQQSGVSARTSIANAELLIANAERRCLTHGETHIVPRISDLQYLAAGCRGKFELLLAENEQAEDKLIASIIGEAVKTVFKDYSDVANLSDVIDAFADNNVSIEIGDEVSTNQFVEAIDQIHGLKKIAMAITTEADDKVEEAGHLASAAEFILESLYVSDRLSKYAYQGKCFFKR